MALPTKLTLHIVSPDQAITHEVDEVSLPGVEGDFGAALERRLAAHRPGQTPLRLSYGADAASTEVDLGEAWRVRATPALVEALASLPGVKEVQLQLARAVSAVSSGTQAA